MINLTSFVNKAKHTNQQTANLQSNLCITPTLECGFVLVQRRELTHQPL